MADQSDGGQRPSSMLDGANTQLFKTVCLILGAILIGVVLLNVVDDGTASTSKPVGTTSTTKGKGPNTTGSVPNSVTPTTKATTTPKKPAEVKVMVLNGSGVNGVAGTMSKALKGKGYTLQLDANTLVTTRKGSAVQCRVGLDAEAKALAVQVANKSKVEPFPATMPKLKLSTDKIDPTVQCLVILGT
jgi:LytR cell envelope-related transcriptional attenuator